MNRRDFLKATTATAVALSMPRAATAAQSGKKASQGDCKLAPPCGLYCGICIDYVVNKECHGCGCECSKCAGKWHNDHCDIAKCAKGKGLESCADCEDMPCTRLIQFTCDPIWRTHAPCIENLRRRKKIGTDKWLAEQEQHWSHAAQRKRWLALYRECSRKARDARKKK